MAYIAFTPRTGNCYRSKSGKPRIKCVGNKWRWRLDEYWRKSFDSCASQKPNIKLMMFNNEIYGLTKGQYSPTSQRGVVTKSTPFGSLDEPFNPAELALGAKSTFFARTLDRDPKHMQAIIHRANAHKAHFVCRSLSKLSSV